VVRPDTDYAEPLKIARDPRVEIDEDWAIENEFLRAVCDPAASAGSVKLLDKRDGREYILDGFSYVEEDPSRGMTAWTTGDPMSRAGLSKELKAKRSAKGALYNELSFSVRFGEKSSLKYTIGLYAGADQLILNGDCDFLEVGDAQRLPQLRFDATDPSMLGDKYLYDIPGGVVCREPTAMDLPGIRFVAGDNLALLSDSKYGYQGRDGSLGVTLIRNSTDPDRFPELGNHRFQLAVAGSHCKITLVRTIGGHHLTIHGSANLRSSSNVEQFMLNEGEALYRFNRAFLDRIIDAHKTIDKRGKILRGDTLWQAVAERSNESTPDAGL